MITESRGFLLCLLSDDENASQVRGGRFRVQIHKFISHLSTPKYTLSTSELPYY